MRTAGRHSARPARWGGAAVVLVIALLLVGAPRAGGDPMPGPPPAAGLGTDVAGLAFDTGGRLYAADLRADRVVVLDPAGGAPGALGAGALEQPTGVAIAPGGDVLVADRHGVRRFAPDGTTVATWPADEAAGIAVSADGTVYVSEAHDVARFSGAGARLGGWAADRPRGIAVAADGTVWVAVADALVHVTAAGAPLGATPADHAEGVAVAPDGTVLVAERERDRVARITPDGTPAGTIEDDFDEPRGVAVDCRGAIAISDDSPARLHRIAAAGAPAGLCPVVTAATATAAEPVRPVARRLTATPAPAPALLPSLGRTALVASASGRVFVRLPGARDAAPLGAGTLLPIGARIDARSGRVALAFATRTADFDRLGTVQRGDVTAGIFSIVQRPGASLVELRLAGPRPRCGRTPATRRLLADVHGRFRTRGAHATATATSARWLTEDRCTGTLVRVTRGVVRVHDEVRGRTVRVRAGGRVLVPPARRG
jgi:DNA-binding beta-propeller fold protein YncE